MKWTNQKREPYSTTKRGIKGRKDNLLFEISAYTMGFSRTHLGWYASVTGMKSNKRHNSLWNKLWWEDIKDAKKWCEEFKWGVSDKKGDSV